MGDGSCTSLLWASTPSPQPWALTSTLVDQCFQKCPHTISTQQSGSRSTQAKLSISNLMGIASLPAYRLTARSTPTMHEFCSSYTVNQFNFAGSFFPKFKKLPQFLRVRKFCKSRTLTSAFNVKYFDSLVLSLQSALPRKFLKLTNRKKLSAFTTPCWNSGMIVIIREWLNAEIKALYEVCWHHLYMSVQTQTLVQSMLLVPILQFTHGLLRVLGCCPIVWILAGCSSKFGFYVNNAEHVINFTC